MNRNSFSGIQALNVIMFIVFAKLVIAGSLGFFGLVIVVLGETAGPLVIGTLGGIASAIYGLQQAWITAFGEEKFGKRETV